MPSTRRTFLTAASGVALGTRLAAASAQGANDRIRIGVIGTGNRARSLMSRLKEVRGVELTALCDVYETSLDRAMEHAPAARRVADYRRVLDDPSIDAVLIGTPDHWHRTMTIDAVKAGKDVYVEKPISRTIEEGEAMVQAVLSSKLDTSRLDWKAWLGPAADRPFDPERFTFWRHFWDSTGPALPGPSLRSSHGDRHGRP